MSDRATKIQRVREFLDVFDRCAGQRIVCTTGAATALLADDLREVLATIDLAQELLNRAKARGELMEVPSFVQPEAGPNLATCAYCGEKRVVGSDAAGVTSTEGK